MTFYVVPQLEELQPFVVFQQGVAPRTVVTVCGNDLIKYFLADGLVVEDQSPTLH